MRLSAHLCLLYCFSYFARKDNSSIWTPSSQLTVEHANRWASMYFQNNNICYFLRFWYFSRTMFISWKIVGVVYRVFLHRVAISFLQNMLQFELYFGFLLRARCNQYNLLLYSALCLPLFPSMYESNSVSLCLCLYPCLFDYVCAYGCVYVCVYVSLFPIDF